MELVIRFDDYYAWGGARDGTDELLSIHDDLTVESNRAHLIVRKVAARVESQ
jgi:hypothetical protein